MEHVLIYLSVVIGVLLSQEKWFKMSGNSWKSQGIWKEVRGGHPGLPYSMFPFSQIFSFENFKWFLFIFFLDFLFFLKLSPIICKLTANILTVLIFFGLSEINHIVPKSQNTINLPRIQLFFPLSKETPLIHHVQLQINFCLHCKFYHPLSPNCGA